MQETILITGATGLVGTHLTQLLIKKGYTVHHISRKCGQNNKASCFTWNLETGHWDKGAINGVGYIIHLAGANVAEGRWTGKRKQQILDSRVKSSQLVCEMVRGSNGAIKGVVSASAVGFYGTSLGKNSVDESSIVGDDFLARVCQQWEEAILACETNVTLLRTGIVLSSEGGAVSKMAIPVKWGVGSPLGSGDQPMPWIHITDLCEMFVFALENNLAGAYNAVAPQAVNNAEFTYQLASALNRKIIFPKVPSFVLKLVLGEMSEMLLTGVNASSAKIDGAGFKFRFLTLSKAFENLFAK